MLTMSPLTDTVAAHRAGGGDTRPDEHEIVIGGGGGGAGDSGGGAGGGGGGGLPPRRSGGDHLLRHHATGAGIDSRTLVFAPNGDVKGEVAAVWVALFDRQRRAGLTLSLEDGADWRKAVRDAVAALGAGVRCLEPFGTGTDRDGRGYLLAWADVVGELDNGGAHDSDHGLTELAATARRLTCAKPCADGC